MIHFDAEHHYPTLPIKSLESDVRYCQSVLMGHYLIVQIHDSSDSLPKEDFGVNSSSSKNGSEPATLWAIDLRDNTVIGGIHMKWFYLHEEYSFFKYGENQIIMFGGTRGGYHSVGLYRIIIESFQPFRVKCEKIKINGDKDPNFSQDTAQLYEDALYVYGSDYREMYIWRFDLNSLTWKLCQTVGEGPGRRKSTSSFLIEDNMYIYGGYAEKDPKRNDIFVLNLNSLVWNRLQQDASPGKQNLYRKNICGAIYQGNLFILKPSKDSDKDELACWNIKTNSWSTFPIQKHGFKNDQANLTIYKNLLIATGTESPKYNNKEVSLTFLDLNKFGLPLSESPEKKYMKALFMKKEGSDIQFKVQDKIIPAHKQIVILKSKYFAGLFNSGMIESRQEVIEINDCEFPVFQEFLRYIYYGQVEELDAHIAIKLIALADKYLLQGDLHEKCLDFLAFNINSKNIYTILEFASKEDISHIRSRCMACFRTQEKKYDLENIPRLIRFLDEKSSILFAEDNLRLQEKAFQVVSSKYTEMFRYQKFYADFLIRKIDLNTIERLVHLILHSDFKNLQFNYDEYEHAYASMEEAQGVFEHATTNLRKHVLDFVRVNSRENEFLEKFDLTLLVDLMFDEIYGPKKCENRRRNMQKNQAESDIPQKNSHKRKEPCHEDIPNENPLLKQTKKGSHLNKDKK